MKVTDTAIAYRTSIIVLTLLIITALQVILGELLPKTAALRYPEQLALDVAGMRAAGVKDLSLFSLEGVLSRDSPEAWLKAFTELRPSLASHSAHRTWRRRLMWGQVPSYLTRMLAERV